MSDINYKKLGEFTSIFHGLSGKELKLVTEIVKSREVEAGTFIIKEGDTGTELFLLEGGIVDIHKTLTIVTSKHEFGTKERTFIRLSGEDHCFFGEMALFGSGERSATVKAVTKCNLLVLEGENFLELAKNNSNIGYIVVTNIALILSKHLRKTNEDILKLTTALSLALSG